MAVVIAVKVVGSAAVGKIVDLVKAVVEVGAAVVVGLLWK